ncbi:hypothetical protein RCC89_06340 [Cytophagaceae bacterium ABcell3]|nr:hypothetical protein RCC89_06340 [Cytophagaceae bacterium ABcell3]
MRNFVVVYRFRDQEAEKAFTRFLIDKYPEHRKEKSDLTCYLGIPARHPEEVNQHVNEAVDKIDRSEGDYVGLYFTRGTGSGNVKQEMLYGNSSYLENDLEKVTRNFHDLTVFELLDEDYLRERMIRNSS